MVRILGLFLGLGLAISGFSLEVASPPILFPTEILVVYTEPGENPPLVCALPFRAEVQLPWQRTISPDGRIRWETPLAGLLSEGAWEIFTDKGAYTFLVANPFHSVVEVLSQTGSLVQIKTARGETFTGFPQPPNPLTFIIPSTCGGIKAWLDTSAEGPNILRPKEFSLFPSTRMRLFLPNLRFAISSLQALPGTVLTLSLFSTFGLAALTDLLLAPQNFVEITVPSGWGIEQIFKEQCCSSYKGFVPWLKIAVPASATFATYKISLTIHCPENPEFIYRVEAEEVVTDKLSPEQVIGHWDVSENRLDLGQPHEITYERLLWAVTLLGKEIPYTGVVMTEELLKKLADQWTQSSP